MNGFPSGEREITTLLRVSRVGIENSGELRVVVADERNGDRRRDRRHGALLMLGVSQAHDRAGHQHECRRGDVLTH